MKRVRTRLLEVAYLEWGAADGAPVVCVHGWPDDALTWGRVAARLADAGLRVVAPYLRGFGPTRFLDPATPRSGQLAALGQDLIEFAEALGLARYALVGHDWGARAAYIASALAPERITHCVGLSVDYGTNSPSQPLAPAQLHAYWYHWLMATERGRRLVREERRALTRYIWDLWLPFWRPGEAEFEATAASFDNPDWAEIVLHSYTVRWGHAAAHPMYAELEARLEPPPKVRVPTLTLQGADDPVSLPALASPKDAFFAGRYARRLVERCGHFPQREHPERVAAEICAWLGASAPRPA